MQTDLFQPFTTPARHDALRPVSGHARAGRQARAIRIQQSRLAGFRHHAGERLRSALQLGSELRLVREPDNAHDPYAVAVYWHHYQLGYLARRDNTVVARLLDNARPLRCTVERLYWQGPQAEIDLIIWLERPTTHNS